MIPFNKSSLEGKELDYIYETISNGQIAGNQMFSIRSQIFLEKITGTTKALLTTSCTHALEMSALLIGISPGDEIILPAFTFVSTANAFVLHGAKPVFCDIRPDTLNLDESKLEALITQKTKAIIPVHYAGIGCEMDMIMEIASRHGVPVVEDNAHGLFGKYRGKYLGTFGSFATQSFHETKNITCGEGGALLINEKRYLERAEIIREKGTNRAQFFRGEVNKYSWEDIGSSYVMSDVLAAFLYGQLENWKKIQRKRKLIWDRYNNELIDWAKRRDIQTPFVPKHCEQAYHMYYLILPTVTERSKFIDKLKANNITAVFHYLPLNQSPLANKMQMKGWKKSNCPITVNVSDRIVRLPFYTGLDVKDQSRIIDFIKINL
jgi:dTDP-4-amino-4,6-dideoxygalactose transaminase